MINNEQYENLIILLKIALEFYADKETYLFFKDKDAPITLDEGSQARFALSKIEEIDGLNQDIENDYQNMSDGVINEADSDFLKKVAELQRMKGLK